MNVFRIFFASVLIPLISVGLCATGESSNGKHRVHRTVFISEEGSLRKLGNVEENSTINFPTTSGSSTKTESLLEPRTKISLASPVTKDSLPSHPHPLKIDIKSIKNSTRIDDSLLILDHGEARHSNDWWWLGFLDWAFAFGWKIVSSYLFYLIANTIFGTLWKKFGWNGPIWQFKTTLGKKDHDHNNGHGGHHGPPAGWGGGHGHGHSGFGGGGGQGWGGWGDSSYGHHPHLSFDQTLAMPYVNKYSLKAAKKAAKYTKKAQKLAAKASKYAAKAHVYRLQTAPYSAGWAPAGLPPYGAGHIGGGHGGWRKLETSKQL